MATAVGTNLGVQLSGRGTSQVYVRRVADLGELDRPLFPQLHREYRGRISISLDVAEFNELEGGFPPQLRAGQYAGRGAVGFPTVESLSTSRHTKCEVTLQAGALRGSCFNLLKYSRMFLKVDFAI